MNRSPSEDRELLERCFSGDKKASELLIRRFSDLVYKTIQRTYAAKCALFTHQDLEDLHNTVFLMLFENGCKRLRQYQGRNGCSLASWIRIITVRMVLSHFRKKGLDAVSGRRKQISIEDLPELAGDTGNPWTKLEKAEQQNLLEKGLNHLLPRDRMFVKLHFEQEVPVAEIAATIGITVENAYTIKHRAVRRLQKYIKSVVN